MARLYAHPGFQNALCYDKRHVRPDVCAVAAWCDGALAGVAGASRDCAQMRQIGVDVLRAHRGRGLAAALVGLLARELLAAGFAPYYAAVASNVFSLRVAARAGFTPSWMSARSRFFRSF